MYDLDNVRNGSRQAIRKINHSKKDCSIFCINLIILPKSFKPKIKYHLLDCVFVWRDNFSHR